MTTPYGLRVTYSDGSTHEHQGNNPYELDMASERFQNWFSIEFTFNGKYLAGLYNWDKEPKQEEICD